ncbi:Uncharacterized protein GBIM_02275 [Gryllus bimaculatus]|nr:Uncharacterized protein GBIM_02275 [Gryllus bimaculatus]
MVTVFSKLSLMHLFPTESYDGERTRAAMSELQATVEFSVELYKFFNVDLFQRGLNGSVTRFWLREKADLCSHRDSSSGQQSRLGFLDT